MAYWQRFAVLGIYLLGFHAMPVLHRCSHDLDPLIVSAHGEREPTCCCIHQEITPKQFGGVVTDAAATQLRHSPSASCSSDCHLCQVIASTAQIAEVAHLVSKASASIGTAAPKRQVVVYKVQVTLHGARGPPVSFG